MLWLLHSRRSVQRMRAQEGESSNLSEHAEGQTQATRPSLRRPSSRFGSNRYGDGMGEVPEWPGSEESGVHKRWEDQLNKTGQESPEQLAPTERFLTGNSLDEPWSALRGRCSNVQIYLGELSACVPNLDNLDGDHSQPYPEKSPSSFVLEPVVQYFQAHKWQFFGAQFAEYGCSQSITAHRSEPSSDREAGRDPRHIRPSREEIQANDGPNYVFLSNGKTTWVFPNTPISHIHSNPAQHGIVSRPTETAGNSASKSETGRKRPLQGLPDRGTNKRGREEEQSSDGTGPPKWNGETASGDGGKPGDPGQHAERKCFGCPFQKHNPWRYLTVRGKKEGSLPTCLLPLSPFKRVKEHLRDHHSAKAQCLYCGQTWGDLCKADIERHLTGFGCIEMPKRLEKPEHMTAQQEHNIERRLPTRVDPVELWKMLYESLFPAEPVPIPYYNAVVPPCILESPQSTPQDTFWSDWASTINTQKDQPRAFLVQSTQGAHHNPPYLPTVDLPKSSHTNPSNSLLAGPSSSQSPSTFFLVPTPTQSGISHFRPPSANLAGSYHTAGSTRSMESVDPSLLTTSPSKLPQVLDPNLYELSLSATSLGEMNEVATLATRATTRDSLPLQPTPNKDSGYGSSEDSRRLRKSYGSFNNMDEDPMTGDGTGDQSQFAEQTTFDNHSQPNLGAALQDNPAPQQGPGVPIKYEDNEMAFMFPGPGMSPDEQF